MPKKKEGTPYVPEQPTTAPPDDKHPWMWGGPTVGWFYPVVDDPEDFTPMRTPGRDGAQ